MFTQGLDKVVGWLLPLRSTSELAHAPDRPAQPAGAERPRWLTSRWWFRDNRLVLVPGDSPVGFRLPLNSLPWVADEDLPKAFPKDPYADDADNDALAAAAKVASADDRVERVVILTPDKDLGQCCAWPKVVQYDRRNQVFRDADGVREKFGVDPESIPDWLGLVGDTADGFPGLPGWGAKSAAAVLAHYKHLEHIPDAPGKWEISVRSAARLAATLAQQRSDAYLFRTIATLQTDADVGTVDDWRWSGPTPKLGHYAQLLDAPDLLRSAQALTNR